MVVLFKISKTSPLRLKLAWGAIAISSFYMITCFVNKLIMDNRVEKTFALAGLSPKQYFTSPTPLNNLLWYVVAESDSGFYIGYSSVFDRNTLIDLEYFPQNNSLLKGVSNQDEVAKLKRFSQGYYTIEKVEEVVVLNDLRFGQIAGWDNPKAKFVFYFFLEKPDMNLLVVQRGRLTGWNKKSLKTFVKRIQGN